MEDGLTSSYSACKRHRKELIKSLSRRSGSRNRKKRKAVKDTLKINGQWIVTLKEESKWGIQDDSGSSILSEGRCLWEKWWNQLFQRMSLVFHLAMSEGHLDGDAEQTAEKQEFLFTENRDWGDRLGDIHTRVKMVEVD